MLDDKARKTALTLLAKFGKNATYSTKTGEVYDPSTSENVATYATQSIKAFIDKPTQGDITSGLATASDAMILVAASGLSVTPKNGDTIVFSERTYTVKANKEVWSGEKIALHQLISVAL